MELKIFQNNWFLFFQVENFTPYPCRQQSNFNPFWCPWQPNFTPFQCPWQPNFTPFRCPRQLLWTRLERWGKAAAWQKFSLLKLRNTGAPSTKWGTLLFCTLYTVQCTVCIVHCILYIVHCVLYTVHCTLYTPTYLLLFLKKIVLENFPKKLILIFSDWKFYSVSVSPTTKFYSISVS